MMLKGVIATAFTLCSTIFGAGAWVVTRAEKAAERVDAKLEAKDAGWRSELRDARRNSEDQILRVEQKVDQVLQELRSGGRR
jgi:hypothetical protein